MYFSDTLCNAKKRTRCKNFVELLSLSIFPYFRLSEEESASLLDLITCKAPATAAGVKFVSLGLCMFIACNSLISSPESERRVVAWIQWLVAQAAHFEQVRFVLALGEPDFGNLKFALGCHQVSLPPFV